ncbi:type IV pilus modification PilV family protein [Acidithiobacillus sulfuriphilus]|uniref:type IV pilus modification PilV family protein n=1 Tax=Acidithiobacillus sulfuriphilus TaxID=1867749 RepID=UPI003F625043
MNATSHDPIANGNEGGFNLIEVTIAIAIFVFGVLALAYLQMAIVKLNSDSQYLTTANNAAQGMAGYLWAAVGDGSNVSTLLQYDQARVSAAGINAPNATAAGVSANLAHWRQSLLGLNANDQILADNGLPQGIAQISNIQCTPSDGSNGKQLGHNRGQFGNNDCSVATPCACTASIGIHWQGRFGAHEYNLTVPIGF